MGKVKYGPEVKEHAFKVVENNGWASTPRDVRTNWKLGDSWFPRPSLTTIKKFLLDLVQEGRLKRGRGWRFTFLPVNEEEVFSEKTASSMGEGSDLLSNIKRGQGTGSGGV